MKTFFQRLGAGGALAAALLAAAPSALAAPPVAVGITAPANNAVIGPLSSPANIVAITGMAQPSGGGAFITQIQYFANGVSVGIDTTPGFFSAVFWTPPGPGIYTLTNVATDSSAASNNTLTSAPITVTITAVRVTSVAAPAANATIPQGSSVVLRGTASMSDGVVASVEFLLRDGVNPDVSLGTVTSAPYFVLTAPITAATGTYNLIARATATAGGPPPTWESTATYPITIVGQVGNGPAVSIVAPLATDVIAVGNAVTVTASATDSDGFIPNTAPGGVSFYADGELIATDLTAPYSVNWTPTLAKTVTLVAVATDNQGNSRAVTRTVTVLATAPTVSITSPTNNSNATVGNAVTVNATATAGVGTTITNVQFRADGVDIGAPDTTAPYSVSWIPATAGSVVLTARVTDSNTTVVTSAPINVNVGGVPTVSLTNPPNGATVTLNTVTNLTASASASPGASVTRVDYFLNGTTLIGTGLTSPFSVAWTPTPAGVASLTARVTDSANATATSTAALVTVVSGGVGTLTATITLAGSPTIPSGSTRVVTVAATGGTGVYDRAELFYDGTLVGTDTTAPYNFLFTAPIALGSHSLVGRMIDSNAVAASSAALPITLTSPVGIAPLVAIATPSNGSFVGASPAVTPITGTASDGDGAVSTVQVFVNGTAIGNATLAGSTWSINWTPSASGVASISALATDNSGNSVAAAPVGVTVTDGSSPAITIALTPGTLLNGVATLPSGATRNIVATVTPSSGRATVRVEFFVDGTKIGEDTSLPYTFRYVAPELAPGEQSHAYVLSARATDNAGAARDVLQSLLVVSPLGQPPTISLLTPANNASAVPNTALSLAATSLASAGGTITSVQFYQNGTPIGNPIVPPATFTSSFTPTAPGTYVIDAIATDDRGNTTVSNSATITAAFTTPTVTITSPNPNTTARATPNVPLNLAANAVVQAGAGAAILLVEFLIDGVQVGADTTAPYSFSWTPTVAQLGAHVLRARVTDTNSQTALSAPVNINVANLVGTPPNISISTQPIPAQGLQTLSQVNFVANASASATGVTITGVEFFLADTTIGTATREQQSNIYRLVYDFSRFDFSTAPSITDPNTGVTRYTPIPLYAIVRDSAGNQTVSPTANLTVNPSTSLPPAIQPVQSLLGGTVIQGQQFLAGVVSSDPDGTVALVQLMANGVIVAQQANPTQGQVLTWIPNTPGIFNIIAIATDDTGNTTVSTPAIRLQVDPVIAPTTSITLPSDDLTVTTVNAPVFVEGTATSASAAQPPTLLFIVTGSGGANRSQIFGQRVGTTNVYRAIWTPTVPDTYTVATQASVGQATTTSTLSRRVVVNNLVGLAPTVAITNPPGSTTTVSAVNLTATASDSDGAVISVEFFVNRNSIGQAVRDQLANTWRLTTSFIGVPPGNAEVVARARDSEGNIAASGTSNVNVVAASSIAPTITMTPSTLNPAFNRQVQLTANARDSDGTVSSVQYFVNATSLGTSGNAGTNYQINWTPNASGTFNLYAIATDNTNNTTVSSTVVVTVRANNPVLENAAFILQTYQDIANTTNINPLVFAELDAQLTAGTLTRAELVTSLVDEPGFAAPVNTLLAYYVLMGQWPTPANYATVLTTVRQQGLAAAIGAAGQGQGTILGSNEYFAKFGVVPTAGLLNNPASAIPADTFIVQLWQSAGLPAPSALANLQFRSNNVLSATLGRGYNVGGVGLQQALAEFLTNTNSLNTALYDKARAAALYYQLDRPPVTVTVDQITARIATLVPLGEEAGRPFLNNATLRLAAFTKPVADAVLKDILYGYRYVTITRQPQSLTVAPRSGALFTVEAQGAPPLAYQWLLNGAPIANARSSTLSLTNVDASRVGTYTVAVTSSVATATSDPATLTLSNTPTRLANISTRGVTTAGDNVLIGGFVVTGANPTQTRQMLIRVIGPTLGAAPFNVAGVLANPRLEVYTGASPNPVLTNDDWATQAGGGAAQVTAIQQAAVRAGAFALNPGSADAAALVTLPPGSYTVQARGPVNNPAASGVVLIEVYDVTQGTAAGPKAANVATRGPVGTGANVLIAGFVVNGAVSRRMLIRGVGPTLTRFGVPGVLADPQISLANQATGTVIRTNDDWASSDDAGIIAAAATAAGAFPLTNGSKDAAMIVMLAPGAYTVTLSGVSNGTGVGIVEVYDVDP